MRLPARLFWFIVAGAAGFLVDAGVLLALVALGAEPRAARLPAILAAMVVTWLINRRRTFGDRAGPPGLMEFLRYVAASAVASLANLGVYVVLVSFGEPFVTRPLLALIPATLIAMALNFWSYGRLVFRKRA